MLIYCTVEDAYINSIRKGKWLDQSIRTRIGSALLGPSRFVNQLYAKIINDVRHSNIELISYESIDATPFFDWNMRFLDLRKLPPSVHAFYL
ncbi:BLUF domain-containing protein [Candidatus Pelagisphaera phototrophica]|nr:BLUF domain-containing protein [Candidatus Pelagisphaera phototrophica]